MRSRWEDTAGSLVLVQVHARDPEEAEKKACAELVSKPIIVCQVVAVLEIAPESPQASYQLSSAARRLECADLP
jgi:hypothetical protein